MSGKKNKHFLSTENITILAISISLELLSQPKKNLKKINLKSHFGHILSSRPSCFATKAWPKKVPVRCDRLHNYQDEF